MGFFSDGILYDPKWKKLFEGEFINNQPKEIKNNYLYKLNENTKFIGDLSEGKYQGFCKLYKDSKLLYEGNFKDGLYEDNGILFINVNIKYKGLFNKGKI